MECIGTRTVQPRRGSFLGTRNVCCTCNAYRNAHRNEAETSKRLELSRDYMHAKGITIGNEPGGILVKSIQDGVNQVFSQPSMPFRWTFMVDVKTMADKYKDDAQVIEESEV